jgi:acetamidase/formamidase
MTIFFADTPARNRLLVKWLGWLVCLVPAVALAQSPLAGEWLVTEHVEGGGRYYHTLTLTVENGKLGGEYNGGAIEGSTSGDSFEFVSTDRRGNKVAFSGSISGERMSLQRTDRPAGTSPLTYSVRRIPRRPPGPPKRHEFAPTTYYRQFSSETAPVLTVWPGDTIHTTTVDSGGTDGNGVGHGIAGNPLTGPFYVETALPGDTLAVHFTRVRLNRDWAMTGASLVPRVLTQNLAVKIKDIKGGGVRWHLDRERGVATIANAEGRLKDFSVPLRPMLGCVGVAPRGTPMPAGDSGVTGGNMDMNEIVEGATVYLPIIEPGALLYVGDGHAVQGEGELSGSGLETSLEVEFTVDIVHPLVMTPRVESPTHLIAVGLAGSLEEAMRSATAGMVQWLEQDYKLSIGDIAQILNTVVEYSINEVADRNAGVVARINKKHLASLAVPKK